MDNLVNNLLGGYNSWLYQLVMWGTLVIALSVGIKWAFVRGIGIISLLLGYAMIDYKYRLAAPNISDPTISGVASTLPVLFLAIGLFVLIDPTVVARIFRLIPPKNISPKG